MKKQIEIVLLLLLALGSAAINTCITILLITKTILGTILIEEVTLLAIASMALAVEIIAAPYIFNIIREQGYYSQPYIMKMWINPKRLCTKIFSLSVFIVIILIVGIFTHKPNNEVYRVTPLQYEQLQNISEQEEALKSFKDYFISSQRILNNPDHHKDWEKEEYLNDKKTIEHILWGDTLPEDIDCLY